MTDETHDPARPEALYGPRSGDGLTRQQLDGLACTECGIDALRVPSMVPAGHVPGSGQVFRCADGCATAPHVCPELPDVPPSLEWTAALGTDDQADLLADVQYAATRGLPELEQVLRLWWVVAKNHGEPHGLPVVDEAAVTAAPRVRGGLLGIADSGPLCDNCHGPGPLVPHPYDMQVCRTCYPEADAFAATAQDGGA